MTAIAGIWSFSGRGRRREHEQMLHAQQIYGPRPAASWDDGAIRIGLRGYYDSPSPVIGGDGRYVLVGDVRLDNREELGSELRLEGQSDSDLVMRAFERWGGAAIAKLEGDFALAIWDAAEQRLLLARDFLGQRPLHYHRGSDFFAFASMPKGLHAIADVPYEPCREGVSAFLALLPEHGSATCFAGIEKVPAGHWIAVTRDGIEMRRHWTPPEAQLRLKDPREYEEAVRVELDRAVAVRLRNAGAAVGAHLSAGLDSSGVAATAAIAFEGRGKVVGYTAVPRRGYSSSAPGLIFDEGPFAAEVAARYPNIEHVKVAASGTSPMGLLDRYFHLFERPFLNLPNGVWLSGILDDAKARKLSVMLTGQSGNMSFSYDGMGQLPDLLRSGRLITLARTCGSLRKWGVGSATLAARTLGPFLPETILRLGQRLREQQARTSYDTLLRPELIARLGGQTRAGASPVMRAAVLQRVDKGNYNKGMLGGWGVDVRDPTADRRLVELCLAIPPEQFLAGGAPRSLARRVLSDRLPASICWERRRGYQAADWHEALSQSRSELAEELRRIANAPMAVDVLDMPRMAQLFAAWPAGGWHSNAVTGSYRLALLRGLSAGHFIRSASRSNG